MISNPSTFTSALRIGTTCAPLFIVHEYKATAVLDPLRIQAYDQASWLCYASHQIGGIRRRWRSWRLPASVLLRASVIRGLGARGIRHTDDRNWYCIYLRGDSWAQGSRDNRCGSSAGLVDVTCVACHASELRSFCRILSLVPQPHSAL